MQLRIVALSGLTLTLAVLAVPATQTFAAPGCSVSYSVVNQWNNTPTSGGFQTNLTITNSGTTTFNGWSLTFAFANGQTITGLWNATFTQSGSNVTVTSNQTWNQTIAPGGVMNSVGFTGAWTGTNGVPTSFSVNGVVCAGGAVSPTATPTPVVAATNTPTRTPTAVAGATNTPTRTATPVVGATSTPTRTPTVPVATSTPTRTPTVPVATSTPTPTPVGPTATPTPSPTPPPAGTHLDNPFAGARGYVNANWRSQVTTLASSTGGTLGQQMNAVSNTSTAVWMDRIAAIDGGSGVLGLADHLNAAVTQSQQSGQPVSIIIVVYDLPNRDCAALASNGELLIAQNGLTRYKTEYINRIAQIFSDPAYANLRIVGVVEPDSIPNLVTNLNLAPCQEAESSGAYVEGVRYAINTLRRPNVYLYLDIAHSGWLGWPTNFNPAIDRFVNLLTQGSATVAAPGANAIDGFISNTANYTPTEEVFLPDPNLQVGGNPILNSTFFEFNPRFDERDYATDLRAAFIARGLTGPSGTTLGMLIDTSRNGWGCTQSCPLGTRPTQVSTSTVTNTYVDESRIDRRPHRGGWCNQNGAGIGARPQAAPFAGVDAFVWVKPPGESDGTSTDVPDPQDPAKKFDAMCDPNARNRYNNAFPTNALPNAPHAGRWFPEQFAMLVRNAFPAIQP